MPSLTYRSYAKVNFYLDVRDRRPDGYHNIETIFQTVSLCDTLTFAPCDARITMTCNRPDLECGERNLVVRAARLLQRNCDCPQGVTIHLEKRIPLAAGLAGGSGNAAATLTALNRLWDLQLQPERLAELGAMLGADVPYCLSGGTAAATLRGEHLTRLPELPCTWLVLVHPPFEVSTAAVYTSPLLGHNLEPAFEGWTASFRKAVEAVQRGDIEVAIFNRMEVPVFHMQPSLAEKEQELVRLGCTAAAMSGSGPTLFGLCRSQSHAHEVAAAFTSWKTSVVHTVPCGVEGAETQLASQGL